MTTNANRTPEQVTREIAREREQLASAVAHLRVDLKQAADVKAILRAQAPKLALVAAVYVGYKAIKLFARQRRRESAVEHALGRERATFGRFTIVERD